jgi:hypothetical protein
MELRVHYCVHKSPLLVAILFPPDILKFCFMKKDYTTKYTDYYNAYTMSSKITAQGPHN